VATGQNVLLELAISLSVNLFFKLFLLFSKLLAVVNMAEVMAVLKATSEKLPAEIWLVKVCQIK